MAMCERTMETASNVIVASIISAMQTSMYASTTPGLFNQHLSSDEREGVRFSW